LKRADYSVWRWERQGCDLPYNADYQRSGRGTEKELTIMTTIIFGAAITLGVFIIMILVFRHRGEQSDGAQTGTYFSTYDGGHDGLGQSGGDWAGREAGHEGGSRDGGWGDSGSGGDGGDTGGGE
jgi:hypothetical protein